MEHGRNLRQLRLSIHNSILAGRILLHVPLSKDTSRTNPLLDIREPGLFSSVNQVQSIRPSPHKTHGNLRLRLHSLDELPCLSRQILKNSHSAAFWEHAV